MPSGHEYRLKKDPPFLKFLCNAKTEITTHSSNGPRSDAVPWKSPACTVMKEWKMTLTFMRIENNDEWFVYEGIPERKNKIKRGCAREWENETFFSLSLSELRKKQTNYARSTCGKSYVKGIRAWQSHFEKKKEKHLSRPLGFPWSTDAHISQMGQCYFGWSWSNPIISLKQKT